MGDIFINNAAAFAGKPAPTLELLRRRLCARREDAGFSNTTNLLWELSSPGEAAKAAAWATSLSTMPP
ncbi:hypothetical protein, partial [Pseudomonas tolaasii]